MTLKAAKKPLFRGTDWCVDDLYRMWNVIDEIGRDELKLTYPEPQFEVVTYEQMIDAYTTIGMPAMYSHWSMGKEAIATSEAYRKGQTGLAYELVVNTDPAITYIMENNSATMQALVMGHAVVGHGSFFNMNYLFKQWTKPKHIVQYLQYAKEYVSMCEERYGEDAVESILDYAHALKNFGVDKYVRPQSKKDGQVRERAAKWEEYLDDYMGDDMTASLSPSMRKKKKKHIANTINLINKRPKAVLPEENILYFVEKHSPSLKEWQRELIRIVRKVAQYFYPQGQTKVMNEGWASFVHHHIMTRLWDLNYIDEGSYLEFLSSHCGVCTQHGCQDQHYHGINPYALGFKAFTDLKRICEDPTDEDKEYFPTYANTDWLPTLTNIMIDYRDESFMLQNLSPNLIRDFKFVELKDTDFIPTYRVADVHDRDGIDGIRKVLSDMYNRNNYVPHLAIKHVDWDDTRTMTIIHYTNNHQLLHEKTGRDTIAYLEQLWGYPVKIITTTYEDQILLNDALDRGPRTLSLGNF